MTILIFFAFIAGLVTILAPCIWPLLPIVLSVSSSGGKRKPLGITLGVMTSFLIYTLFVSYLIQIFHFDPNTFRLVAVIIIGLLGLSLLIPALGAKLETWISVIAGPLHNKSKSKGEGFVAGYVSGFSLGLLWAPCAGPILATVAALSATQEVNAQVILISLSYVLGVGIPLFFFSCAGSLVFAQMRKFNKYTGRIQQFFGLIMIASAILLYTNYDKTIQIKILEWFPSYGNFLYSFEHRADVQKELAALRGDQGSTEKTMPAAEITGINTWINSSPLTLAQLKGKIVLIDFWTYSCINCVRTLPHVTAWYEKYKDFGFVTIGVHTPEFAFEKLPDNVKAAVKQFNIHFPVALDNDYKTWRAFKNHYWPAKYLIDAKGIVRYTHFGEGKYEETEAMIRSLLKENGQTKLPTANTVVEDYALKISRTPETYLGKKRMQRFASPEQITGSWQNFTTPSDIDVNHFAYAGTWTVTPESAIATANATLTLHFKATKVFLVMGPKNPDDHARVLIDGKPIEEAINGKDTHEGFIVLDRQRLYEIVDLKGKSEEHQLQLEFKNEGIAVYAFTFG